MNEDEIARLIVQEVVKHVRDLEARSGGSGTKPQLTIALSARHCHLSPADLAALFGPGYELTKMKDLSQPGQFAAHETVELIGPRGKFPRVRILGPARGRSQVEISITDAVALGIPPVVRLSGDHRETPGAVLRGPKGEVTLPAGVIVAARHIHMHTSDAEAFGVRDGQVVKVRTHGPRALIFDNAICRVSPNFRLEMHVDFDEGNAAGARDGDPIDIIP